MLAKKAYDVVGIRAGEKLHEVMILRKNQETVQKQKKNILFFQSFLGGTKNFDIRIKKISKKVPDDFEYTSDNNKSWLSVKQLQKLAMLNN